jgi:hypothetical protein
MKFMRISGIVLISLVTFLTILITSCAASPATTTVTTTVTTTATSSTAGTLPPGTNSPVTLTVTPPPITVTVSPSPSNTVSPIPTIVLGTDIPKTAKFYTAKEITSYIKGTVRIDGTFDQTPVYSDVFVDLPEIARFGPSDATFVPRIPTITAHEDWFVRFSIPASSMKPWMVNYGYTIKPGDTTTTLSFALYKKTDFDAYYYQRQSELTAADLDSGDRGTTLDGAVHARLMQDKWGDFVIFWRTNNPANVLSWWVRIGM